MNKINFIKDCVKFISRNHIKEMIQPLNIRTISNPIDKVPKNILTKINEYRNNTKNIPIIIGGKEYFRNERKQLCPYDHETTVCNYNLADKNLIEKATKTAMAGREIMRKMDYKDKLNIFEKTSRLIASKYTADLFASTMFGQAKTFHQADIDAICELVDFLRFDNYYYNKMNQQEWNRQDSEYNLKEWNPLNGFVASITPFNFTAIGGHLSAAPALMGNGVVWKPSDYSILSNYVFYQCMLEAGLPPEAVSFVPSEPNAFFNTVVDKKDFGAIAFTGSSQVFQEMYQVIGDSIHGYDCFPRIIGETGGNNFHFIFPDCDINDAADKTVRGAFEYSGQKCSATSRLYLPKTIWEEFIINMINKLRDLTIGSPEEDNIFTSAVIHKNSYLKNEKVIKDHYNQDGFEILYGSNTNMNVGYFISPTIIKCSDPFSDLMSQENFGPILSVYVYNDDHTNDIEKALKICANTGKYALTGAIFTESNDNLLLSYNYLSEVTGNFYINDKCTGSVVGKQPFGGGKLSGTNDKAGGEDFLKRFANCRIIKISGDQA
jgi:1-pyrroline-5-carboxylate dehydrogenase